MIQAGLFLFGDADGRYAKPGAVTQKEETCMVENTVSTIFVCSPYQPQPRESVVSRDQLVSNIEQAKMACQLIVKLGFLPLASHLYFTGFLDDTVVQEREKGMELGQKWVALSDEVWVFGEEITEGMSREIAYAKELGKSVRMIPESNKLISRLLAAI
ncbi:MAG: DUF4406 domain-containing protein [Oliverpabstia sp.]|nr:DUF4406 domain-containing protein [Oliverpabstia sp.]